jgi:hypothetical protein
MARRFWSFSYFTAGRAPERAPELHALRDGHSLLDLAVLVTCSGAEYAGPLLNWPERWGGADGEPNGVSKDDVILLATRPPIHDVDAGDRQVVERSGTGLEQRVFDAFGRFFERCSRSQIVLTRRAAAWLLDKYANRANVQFRQYGGARFDAYQRSGSAGWDRNTAANYRTAAYLLYLPAIDSEGPGLLSAFGVDGQSTLLWTSFLRGRLRHWVPPLGTEEVFLMAEIEFDHRPPTPPDLGFADSWRVTRLTRQGQTESPARCAAHSGPSAISQRGLGPQHRRQLPDRRVLALPSRDRQWGTRVAFRLRRRRAVNSALDELPEGPPATLGAPARDRGGHALQEGEAGR